jgi:coproporphyrinogen III oxidase
MYRNWCDAYYITDKVRKKKKRSGGMRGAGYEYVKIETLFAFVKIKYSAVVKANQML